MQFLAIAKASAGEVKSQLYVAVDQSYISQQDFERLATSATEVGRLIGGLMNYLRNSQMKGTKFK